MTQDTYLLTDTKLLIDDEELGLHVHLSFVLPRLPQNLEEQKDLVLEKDALGHIHAAYMIAQGIKQGACHLFYPEGQLKAAMFYDGGILHGPSTFFSPCQKLLAETWYVQGKKVGKVKYYYLGGQISSLQRYKEGIFDGIQQYWYEDGTVKSQIPYDQGKLHGEVRLFWESGTLKRSCIYFQGLREGWDRLYNESGILIDEGEFQKGQPINTHRHFFYNGPVQREVFYHTPVRFDHKEWDAAGKLVYEGIYASDLTYTERKYLEPTCIRKGYWDGQRLCWK